MATGEIVCIGAFHAPKLDPVIGTSICASVPTRPLASNAFSGTKLYRSIHSLSSHTHIFDIICTFDLNSSLTHTHLYVTPSPPPQLYFHLNCALLASQVWQLDTIMLQLFLVRNMYNICHCAWHNLNVCVCVLLYILTYHSFLLPLSHTRFAYLAFSYLLTESGQVFPLRVSSSHTQSSDHKAASFSWQNSGVQGIQVKQLAMGNDFVVALAESGLVFTAGANDYGQLGHGHTRFLQKFTLVQKLASHPIAQIAAGESHCAALSENGDAYVWGLGSHGQLGLGKAAVIQPVPKAIRSFYPNRVLTVECGTAFTAFAVKQPDDTIAIFTSGNGVASNDAGTDGDAFTPHKLLFPSESQSGVSMHMAAGHSHLCVLSTDGQVFQASSGKVQQVHTGSEVVVRVVASNWYSAACTAAGDVVSWGTGPISSISNSQLSASVVPGVKLLSVFDMTASANGVIAINSTCLETCSPPSLPTTGHITVELAGSGIYDARHSPEDIETPGDVPACVIVATCGANSKSFAGSIVTHWNDDTFIRLDAVDIASVFPECKELGYIDLAISLNGSAMSQTISVPLYAVPEAQSLQLQTSFANSKGGSSNAITCDFDETTNCTYSPMVRLRAAEQRTLVIQASECKTRRAIEFSMPNIDRTLRDKCTLGIDYEVSLALDGGQQWLTLPQKLHVYSADMQLQSVIARGNSMPIVMALLGIPTAVLESADFEVKLQQDSTVLDAVVQSVDTEACTLTCTVNEAQKLQGNKPVTVSVVNEHVSTVVDVQLAMVSESVVVGCTGTKVTLSGSGLFDTHVQLIRDPSYDTPVDDAKANALKGKHSKGTSSSKGKKNVASPVVDDNKGAGDTPDSASDTTGIDKSTVPEPESESESKEPAHPTAYMRRCDPFSDSEIYFQVPPELTPGVYKMLVPSFSDSNINCMMVCIAHPADLSFKAKTIAGGASVLLKGENLFNTPQLSVRIWCASPLDIETESPASQVVEETKDADSTSVPVSSDSVADTEAEAIAVTASTDEPESETKTAARHSVTECCGTTICRHFFPVQFEWNPAVAPKKKAKKSAKSSNATSTGAAVSGSDDSNGTTSDPTDIDSKTMAEIPSYENGILTLTLPPQLDEEQYEGVEFEVQITTDGQQFISAGTAATKPSKKKKRAGSGKKGKK
jgi:Regulator of chromosome condensation (RCC1) repeat